MQNQVYQQAGNNFVAATGQHYGLNLPAADIVSAAVYTGQLGQKYAPDLTNQAKQMAIDQAKKSL